MNRFLANILGKLDGWKSILGYVLAQIFGDMPMLLAAINGFIANPKDPQAALNLVAQLVLAFGLSHRAIKNIVGR
jgi:hypothetical protein